MIVKQFDSDFLAILVVGVVCALAILAAKGIVMLLHVIFS